MLTVIANSLPQPAEERPDQDPGIVTLLGSLARAFARQQTGAFARRCDAARPYAAALMR